MFFLDVDCGGEGILKIIKFIWILLDYVKVIVPMGLIVMVMVDFGKNVISGREDDMKKNVNMVLKRVVFAMAIFLVPSIVQTAIHLLGEYGVDYAFCIDIAVNESDLSKYKTKYESGEFGNNKIVIPESLKKEKTNKKNASSGSDSSSGGSTNYGSPNWNNTDAWINKNPYAPTWIGQCTWFAWGRFYEIYNEDPGFRGNGSECVRQLIDNNSKRKQKFELSTSKPKGGGVFSCRGKNHVGIVVGFDGKNITIQDGNYDGVNNSFEEAKSDWHEYTYDLSSFITNCDYGCCGSVEFANPVNKSHGSGKNNQLEK